MQQLTTQGQQIIRDLAQRYGVSEDAVMTLLQAVMAGNGTMAQFSHPEFGGSGQWMQGGMTMVGDLFNHGLKATVDGLCSELSGLLATQSGLVQPASFQSQSQGNSNAASPEVSLFVSSPASGQWWPGGLGTPSSTGAQNNIRYAYFPAARRLAVDIDGHITIYDTLDHQIGGVSQQQSGNASLTFTSQYGVVPVANLPIVTADGVSERRTETTAKEASATPAAPRESEAGEDIIGKIERLAKLRQKKIISEEEFAAKKAELLSRL